MASNTGNPTECNVCRETFDEGTRCPRNLPCLHHFCSDCINKLIAKNAKICPNCRREFSAKSVDALPVTQVLLDCIKHLESQTHQKEKKGAKHKSSITKLKAEILRDNTQVRQNLDTLQKQTERLIKDVEDTKDNTDRERSDFKETILPQIHNILGRLQRNKEALEPVFGTLQDRQKELQKRKKLMLSMKNKIETTTSIEETAALVDEAEEDNTDAREWTEDLGQVLQQEKGLLLKARKDIKESLRIKGDLMKALSHRTEDPDPTAHGVRRISTQVSVMSLWEMRGHMKDLLEKGKLFALQQQGNTRRSAQITIENNKVYLYSLQNEPTPVPNKYYLQYDEVLRLAGSPSTSFVDVCVQGSTLGRMHILLTGKDSLRFQQLFTGGQEPSYMNRSLHVLDKGSLNEQVLCGIPNMDNGGWFGSWRGGGIAAGGNPLDKFKMRSDNTTWSGSCGGSVCLLDATCSPPLFTIRTGPYKKIGDDLNVLGNATDGLDVISDALRCYDDTVEVTISDCGLMLKTRLPIHESSDL